MKRQHRIRHEFVDLIPEKVEQGVLYVSIKYATAVHSCCCGCGSRVVTPLSPDDWWLLFDGETVSLEPSIGNWNYVCQSHYVIRRDRVLWCFDFDCRETEDKRSKCTYSGCREDRRPECNSGW